MARRNISRVLFYTHNSIGLGHAVRSVAIITGLRRWRPDIEFLVISGTSVPQLFSRHGIEIIKLPSTRLDVGPEERQLKPRYLKTFPLEKVFDFRERIIAEAFDFFEPDVLMIEHNMTGQMNELVPLQLKKWMRRGGGLDFAMAYISRGIMSRGPLLRIPYQNPRHRSESVNIGQLYDFIYVLEDKSVVDVNKSFLGDDPDLEEKIRYLGKITAKTKAEILTPIETRERFDLDDRPLILISLGRFGKIREIFRSFIQGLNETGRRDEFQVLMVLDPYLDQDIARELRRETIAAGVRTTPFLPDLLDLINAAALVLCRAGYNTVNELLLTDTKAVIVAEDHAGGEQEFRAKAMPQENVTIITADQATAEPMTGILTEMLEREPAKLGCEFDKYKLGRIILEDLEHWLETHRI